MTPEQYWDGDAELPKYYRKAYEIKCERRNQELWLQGAYVYEAILDAAPVLHAFAKRNTKPVPYPTEPYALTAKAVEDKREREQEREYEKNKAGMAAWAQAVNRKFAVKEVSKDG